MLLNSISVDSVGSSFVVERIQLAEFPGPPILHTFCPAQWTSSSLPPVPAKISIGKTSRNLSQHHVQIISQQSKTILTNGNVKGVWRLRVVPALSSVAAPDQRLGKDFLMVRRCEVVAEDEVKISWSRSTLTATVTHLNPKSHYYHLLPILLPFIIIFHL